MNNEPQLDEEILSTLREVMGADFPHLIETFIRDSGGHMQRLSQALSDADANAARRSAHSFKGSSSNIGAQRLSSMCQRIEHRAKEGQLEGLQDLLSEVGAEFKQVVSQLQAQRLD